MKASTFLSLLLLCLAALAAIFAFGHYRSEKRADDGRKDLIKSVGSATVDPDLWSPAGLPRAVTRYFNFTLGTEENCPALFETATTGRFLVPLIGRESDVRSRWLWVAGGTGYAHDARVDVVPGVLWLRFLDIYRQGSFVSWKAVNSTLSLRPFAAEQAIESYLVSFWLLGAPLNPASLLMNDRVSWEELDETSAMATVSSPVGARVSAVVTFNRDGGIKGLELKEAIELLPRLPAVKWVEVDAYTMQSGVMAPTRFTFSGVEDNKPVVVWRGEAALTTPK